MPFREVKAYAVRINLSSGSGRVRLWLAGGSTSSEVPDHEFNVSAEMLSAASSILQGDRNAKVYFDANGNVLSGGVDFP